MSRAGSVKKDLNTGGCYYVVDVSEPGQKRRQVRRRFATQRQARDALTAVLADLRSSTYVLPDRTTLAGWVERWAPVLRTQVRASTAHSYERNLRLHALPTLGDRPLQSLRAADLTGLYAELLAGGRRDHTGALTGGGLSLRSVAYLHTILGNPAMQTDAADRVAALILGSGA